MRLLPFVHRHRCDLTPYASQFGALKACITAGQLPSAHQCTRCLNRWHAGSTPQEAVA